MAPKKKKGKKTPPKPKKAARKKAPPRKLAAAKKRKSAPGKKLRKNRALAEKAQNIGTVAFKPEGLRARSGGQSGDLQGLSNLAGADSESVDELLEEGNALEAEIVQGVQDAPDADRSEVRTHEVPEDDVPEEYDDNQ
jgi:hypothetical protein